MKIALVAIFFLFLFLTLGIVGTMDIDDEQKEQDLYCKMVSEGSWPDYNGSYQSKCPKEGKQ